MPKVSDRVLSLQESAIRKLDIAVSEQVGVHFFRLNIGQPDVPTPPPVLRAMADYQPRVVRYGPASGLMACREAAAAYHAGWSPGLLPQHVAVTTGGSEALLFALCAACDPGDEVLVPEPYYTNYNGFARVAGVRVVPVPTHLERGFALPTNAELDRHLSPTTRALVFSNPSNPTGAVYPKAQVRRVVAWAKQHDLFVLADEVYRRIWFDDPPFSALQISDARDHVVVVDSLSKTYSACGLRLGFLISRNGELMETVERLGQARLGPQPLAQHAALAALSLEPHYYEQIRHTYRERVATLVRALGALPGVQVPPPRGAFYTMLRLPVADTEAFARFLVTDFRDRGQSVVVAPGPGFYADPAMGRQQVRLAAVLEPEQLLRAVELLGLALDAYPGS